MRISSVFTRGFPGLPDGDFDLRGPTERASVVVVSGPPGSGKSSLLRAIVAAKEGPYPYGSGYALGGLADEQVAKVGATWDFTPAEVQRFSLSKAHHDTEAIWGSPLRAFPDPELAPVLGSYSLDSANPKMELFHAERSLSQGGAFMHAALLAPLEAGLRLRADNRKYANLKAHAADLFARGSGGALAAAFAHLCSSAEITWARRGRAGAEVWLKTRAGATELNDASSSEREAFLFAATFSRSGVASSIALIDNPERFLPPSRVARFVGGLASLGAENQIIVATSLDDLAAELDGALRIRLRAGEQS